MTTLCQTIKNYCSQIHFILEVDFHQLDEEINSLTQPQIVVVYLITWTTVIPRIKPKEKTKLH